jgi:RNA polymerase sigma-70 factor, ECF subfamily
MEKFMQQTNIDLHFNGKDFSNLLSNEGDLFLKYLFDQYYLEFCKLSFKYVGRTDIAEDIVQEVFINIWNKRFALNYSGKVKPYLLKSVINASINYIKSKFARQDMADEDFAKNTPEKYDPHDELVKSELNQLVKIAIEQLPDKCRAIFMLSRFSDLTYKEIAEQLNISIKTVEAQIGIALKKLQQFLSKLGYFLIPVLVYISIGA